METIKAGRRFERGDGSGYVLVRDIAPGDVMRFDDLKPFGGAPELVSGTMVPEWLWEKIQAVLSEVAPLR